MINIKENLERDINDGINLAIKKGALKVKKGIAPKVAVTHSEQVEHGDYASPVALMLAKHAKKNPTDIVEVIVKHMPKKEYIGSIEVAAPGFINIRISRDWMASRLDDVVSDVPCTGVHVGKGKLVNIEFISANPTGPLTLGNARTAFSADTLGNVLECAGYNVTREYYINDTGRQVEHLGESVLRRILQIQGERVDYPEDMYQGSYIKDMAKDVAEQWNETEGRKFTKSDLRKREVVQSISEMAAEMCLSAIKETVKKDLKIDMDVWTSEQKLREGGDIEKALGRLRKKKLTYAKGGAEYMKTSKFGDSEDRVLVKKDGEYAYVAPDIGYHQGKYDREFDLIFTYLGADHAGHIPKLQAAMEALNNDTSKLHFMVAQWLHITRGGKTVKLSKRKGEIYTPKELIDEVGYDAVRFFMVQRAINSHMDFDINLAKERSEKNPVFYIQYAHVRLQSILRKAKEQDLIDSIDTHAVPAVKPVIREQAEFDCISQMYRWPEVVSDIATSSDVQKLPEYAYELARTIHVFYKEVPVLAAKSTRLVESRLLLVLAARNILGATLDLLGISKPDVM